MSGQPTREQVTAWAEEVDAVGERMGGRFARSKPRRRATHRGVPGPVRYMGADVTSRRGVPGFQGFGPHDGDRYPEVPSRHVCVRK